MNCFNGLVPLLIRDYLSDHERDYLHKVFELYGGFPSFDQLLKLMDEQWVDHRCNPLLMDERITAFYSHPVWLLNGLFIEQDPQSLAHREAFTNWVTSQTPERVADFGGGFGGLARLIGAASPQTSVEVIDPHPHPSAIALAGETSNVRFVPELTGNYDVIIATDVFEHVPEPIQLAASTARHLRIGGKYLIANCFAPVIACHLPQLFHLSIGWDQAMSSMGLKPQDQIRYGRVYQRTGLVNEAAAKQVEDLSMNLYPWIRLLPKGQSRIGKTLLQFLSTIPRR